MAALAVAVLLHVALVAMLLRTSPPPRSPQLSEPIVIRLIEAPKAEPPAPVVEPPMRKPVVKRPIPQPGPPVPAVEAPPTPIPPPEAPIIASAVPAAASSAGEAPVPAPAPIPVVEPSFDAAYLNNPVPSYPPVSRRLGEQGKVLLRVHVDEQGMPTSVVVRTSSGYERLDNVALDTVRRWKFVPAKRGNDPVSAYVIVPIVFNLRS